MNDFALPQEQDAGSSAPNAMAWLGGVHWQRPVAIGRAPRSTGFAAVHLGGEVYYGDPYVYIRESVLRSFTTRLRVHTNYDGSGGETLGRIVWEDEYLGSPYGNDSLAYQFFARLDFLPLGSLDIEILRHHDGELGPADILPADGDAAAAVTPTGTPEYSTRLAAVATASSDGIPGIDWPRFVLSASLTGCVAWTQNAGHVLGATDTRAALGARVTAHWRK